MRPLLRSFALVLALAIHAVPALADLRIDDVSETVALRGRSNDLVLQIFDESARPIAEQELRLEPQGSWENLPASLRTDAEGKLTLEGVTIRDGRGDYRIVHPDGRSASSSWRQHAAWQALLPPLLSIVLALWLRQVFLALAVGVFGGAWMIFGSPFDGYLRGLSDFVVASMTDSFQASILVFTAALGGMVGVMARAGGTHGVVDSAQRHIRGPRSAQLMTAILGLVIFFDDYANTLLVGNTMRPVTDRLKVSREKLSYLVDSTAAPVATIALLSTWVGYQVGLIGDGLEMIGRGSGEAYAMFVRSIPFASYSWFALVLVMAIVLSRRDFGPMLRAERRARSTGKVIGDDASPLVDDVGRDLEPPEGKPRRASIALVPILLVLVGTVLFLAYDGRRNILRGQGEAALQGKGLQDFFSNADPASSLLWAVMLGSIVVIAMTTIGRRDQRILTLHGAVDAWISGAKAMLPALCILVLAWSIGDVCERLGTARVVVEAATGNLSARLVPTIIFLVAAFLGFSTGTSWGTMAILMPIAIPLAYELPHAAGLSEAACTTVLLASVAGVLSGSVLGDHCSPISDTTIMSSMASGSDHVDHVRTQMPYAVCAGMVAILFGTLPAGFGISPWITLPIGAVTIVVVARVFGRFSEAH